MSDTDIIGISARGETRQRNRQVSGSGYNLNPTTTIIDIPITLIKSESHQYSAEKAQNAIETGAKVSDHIIINPMSVDISFEISNLVDGDAQNSYDLLEAHFKSRVTVDLITKHKLLKNMVLLDLNLLNQVPLWGNLVCRAKFEEMGTYEITIETAKYNKTKVTHTGKTSGPDTSESAKNEQNKGNKPPRSSLATKIFG